MRVGEDSRAERAAFGHQGGQDAAATGIRHQPPPIGLSLFATLLRLRQSVGETEPSVIALSGTYHNLLRMWADV